VIAHDRLLPSALVLVVSPHAGRAKAGLRRARGHRARRLRVHVERPVEVSLDGEIVGHVPGDFVLAGEALRVVTGPRFVDVDDPEDAEDAEDAVDAGERPLRTRDTP